MRRLVVTCLIVSTLASCGGDDTVSEPPGESTEQTIASTTPATTEAAAETSIATSATPEIGADGEILYREAVSAFVITTVRAYGEQGLDPSVVAGAVVAYYPSIGVGGYAVEADPSSISIMSTMLNDKDSASAENPYVFGIAVADTSGSCLGVVAYGFPTPDQTFTVEDLSVCTASEVVDQLIAQL